ncbi:hypothetical protein J7F03_38885 [Streptomyces sp. ISL-43]|uniref:hypothetical protein n=1 Tax=Streptomyces sp. ISL-43 TaxID=2819183 RepID=UPI001BE5F408|nr:hypothetical protein [Streptomyces sp. ISL-43]MBT2452901.1 hypothetical protein [Streptomyces sp. ISL-43]
MDDPPFPVRPDLTDLRFGAVMTVAGAVMFVLPGSGLPLLTVWVLVLTAAAAVWVSMKQP